MTASKFVAGTGTIKPDGEVGKIGGIAHKMSAAHDAGATVFLVPAGNCYEANSDKVPGLQLIKVDTLGGAVDALHTRGLRRSAAELLGQPSSSPGQITGNA